MKRIAKFYKVSETEFVQAMKNTFPYMQEYTEMEILDIYHGIKKPKRTTKDSAGYDFFAPFDITLNPGESIKIPTGIRVRIDTGWVLELMPRSGLGYKYRAQLDNTIGVIDGDYFNTDNEGHIMVKITNDSKYGDILHVAEGQGIVQGIFHEYGITEDDDADEIRTGGFGSTTK